MVQRGLKIKDVYLSLLFDQLFTSMWGFGCNTSYIMGTSSPPLGGRGLDLKKKKKSMVEFDFCDEIDLAFDNFGSRSC